MTDEQYAEFIRNLDEIVNHIHTSMCVDGKVELITPNARITADGNIVKGALFRVTDKKRGVFYIGWYK